MRQSELFLEVEALSNQSISFASNQTNLIPFLVAGDPDLITTVELMKLFDEEGVAAIELGVPFSDPVADGPVIQEAAEFALKQGVSIADVVQAGKEARVQGVTTPLILFTYANPVFQYGWEKLFQDLQAAGFQGLIIPDVPYEETIRYQTIADQYHIALIPLVAPTSEQRIAKIVSQAQGFVYCVSSLGTTGVRKEFHEKIGSFLHTVREASPVPIAVGFGVSERTHVEEFSRYASAVIVGSAFVQRIAQRRSRLQSRHDRFQALSEIRLYIQELMNNRS